MAPVFERGASLSCGRNLAVPKKAIARIQRASWGSEGGEAIITTEQQIDVLEKRAEESELEALFSADLDTQIQQFKLAEILRSKAAELRDVASSLH